MAGTRLSGLERPPPLRYIQIKDRAKDVIISGGENISTVEAPPSPPLPSPVTAMGLG